MQPTFLPDGVLRGGGAAAASASAASAVDAVYATTAAACQRLASGEAAEGGLKLRIR